MPNPGSLNEFMTNNGLASTAEAVGPHSEALSKYRVELAGQRGVTLEDLHELPTVTGRVAVVGAIGD